MSSAAFDDVVSGLGSEIGRAAYRDGANVVLAARTPATLEAAAKEIDPTGERVEIVPTDITDEAQCQALAAAASQRFGRVDAMAQAWMWGPPAESFIKAEAVVFLASDRARLITGQYLMINSGQLMT